jgi:murein DD-endopeptidase MepM/ murein hydrolase activator NlpD
LVVLAAVMTLMVGASGSARAQTPPSPPTTKNVLDQLLTQLLTPAAPPPVQTAAVAPVPPPAPLPTEPPPAATAPPVAQEPDTSTQVIPPEYQAILDSDRPRSGSRSTSALLDALRRLEDLGFTPQEAAILGMGRFPVAGPAEYSDDWHDARFGPPFHLHQGNDIFADRGTPALAPDDGTVRFEDGGLGGQAAYVTAADGTYYYMAHLNTYEKSLYNGAPVKQGQVVGTVGNTGNAENGAPHLHFEIHPGGGGAVNPKPFLDEWQAEALDAVPTLLARYGVNVPRAITAAGMLRRFDEGGLSGSGRSPEAALLWASSVSAGGGTLRLAEVAAVRMAGSIDWDRRATTAQEQADVLREARSVASSVLVPLTPPLVVVLLGPAVSHGSS